MTVEMVEYGLKEDPQSKDDDLEASNKSFFERITTPSRAQASTLQVERLNLFTSSQTEPVSPRQMRTARWLVHVTIRSDLLLDCLCCFQTQQEEIKDGS